MKEAVFNYANEDRIEWVF